MENENPVEKKIIEILLKAESSGNVAHLFESAVYASIQRLKNEGDVGAWQRVRHQLRVRGRKFGLRVGILEAEAQKWQESQQKQQQAVATNDLALVLRGCDLIQDLVTGEIYVQYESGGQTETTSASSTRFKDLVVHRHLDLFGEAPSKGLLNQAIDTVCAKGRFDRATRDEEVFSRWAEAGGEIFCALSDGSGRVIKIGVDGWDIQERSPVVFSATTGSALGMPCPVAAEQGNLELLWNYLPCAAEDRVLVLAWLLESWRVRTPYPIMQLTGPQGSAKSSSCKYLRAFIDPHPVGLRAAPKSARDIAVAARNNYLLSYNNLSPSLPRGGEDMLCSIATGGGFAARQLYTDGNEVAFDVLRPVLVNGIEPVFCQPDLIDRLVNVEMPAISQYVSEADLDRSFEHDAPVILSGLLNLMVEVLRKLSGSVEASPEFRMQDFARLGKAVGLALKTDFDGAYRANRREPLLHSLDGIPALVGLQAMVREEGDIASIAIGKLLAQLEKRFRKAGQDCWPRSAKGFASQLSRNGRALAAAGVIVERLDRRADGWHVSIQRQRSMTLVDARVAS